MTDKELTQIFKTQLGIDFSFDPSLLDKDTNTIVEPELFSSNAKRCYYGIPYMNLLYAGKGVVCVAADEIRAFMENYLDKCQDPFRAFDAPNIGALERELNKKRYTIAHIAIFSIPKVNAYREADNMNGIRIFRGTQLEELYNYPGFDMALKYDCTSDFKDVMAVAYYQNNQPIGVAACSNDSDTMWQIGVDVKESFRNKGIATRLLSILTKLILSAGKLPYYCCAYSNIASLNLAKKCGYNTAWCEITAKPIEEEWIQKIIK